MAVQPGFVGTTPVDCAWHIGTGETKFYTRDYFCELSDADGNIIENIVSAGWSYEPDDGLIELFNAFITGTNVGVYVRNAQPQTAYRLTSTITTDTGQIIEAVIGLAGVQKSGTPPIIVAAFLAAGSGTFTASTAGEITISDVETASGSGDFSADSVGAISVA